MAIVGLSLGDALTGHGIKGNQNLNPLILGNGSGSGGDGSGYSGTGNSYDDVGGDKNWFSRAVFKDIIVTACCPPLSKFLPGRKEKL